MVRCAASLGEPMRTFNGRRLQHLSKAPLPWHFARVHFARHAAGGLDEEGEELGFA